MSGMFSPPNIGNQLGNSSVIINHPEVNNVWIIESSINYPDVVIHVDKIGTSVLDPPQIVHANLENLTPQKIRIKFDNAPCSGFAVLQ